MDIKKPTSEKMRTVSISLPIPEADAVKMMAYERGLLVSPFIRDILVKKAKREGIL